MKDNEESKPTNKYFEWWESEMQIQEKLKDKIKALLSKNNDALGRVLKYHLILEMYLNLAIEFKFDIKVEKAKLKFFQKLEILQSDFYSVCINFNKGIKAVNAIRNKFAHKIDAEITKNDMKDILSYTASTNLLLTGTQDNYVKHIELFVLFICFRISTELRGRKGGNDFLKKIFEEE